MRVRERENRQLRNHCVEEGWFVAQAARGEHREGSELKRFVLPNEVNTPSGRMRPPCRAETVVTSVILYKTGRGGRKTRGSIVGSGMRSKVEKENEEKVEGKTKKKKRKKKRKIGGEHRKTAKLVRNLRPQSRVMPLSCFRVDFSFLSTCTSPVSL